MLRDGPVWALGAMSGTSLDGVGAAMVLCDGARIYEFGPTAFRAFGAGERRVLRAGPECRDGMQDVAGVVENAYVQVLARFEGAQVIGFQGQPLDHDLGGLCAVQAGDGAVLAQVLGLPVVWDFVSADIEMGGQGAPMAAFFHFACAKWLGETEPLVFLNLGGVGQVIWVDPGRDDPADTGAILAFDTGPANAPIDDLMQARRGRVMDVDGALAATGNVDAGVVEAFLDTLYFHRVPPKLLDRGDFRELQHAVVDLSDADAAATLTAVAVAAVVQGCGYFPLPPSRILVTGGGRNNPVMMDMLRARSACPVDPVEAVGLDGDMLGPQAIAWLAVRVARGLTTSCPGTTGVAAPIGGGQISWPDSGD